MGDILNKVRRRINQFISSIKIEFKLFWLNRKPMGLGCDGCESRDFYTKYESLKPSGEWNYYYKCGRCGRRHD